ncbi:MAG: DNA pilot protein [Microvirus sp.]|nr:MAG: DNA pilot protein [Microvirus sp.]
MNEQTGQYQVDIQNNRRPNLPGLLGAGINALGGIAQGIFSGIQQKRQNRANRQMAEYEFSKNMQMWQTQNAYNSPEAQMKRFKDAGLNPNLIYGQGSSGNAQQLPRYQAPQVEYVKQLPQTDIIGKYQQGATQQKHITGQDLMNRIAQTDNVRKILDYNYTSDVYNLKIQGLQAISDIQKAKAVFTTNEMETVFKRLENGIYVLRDEYLQSWVKYVGARLESGATTLEKTQADIQRIEAQTESTLSDVELKSYLPLLGKLIQFIQIVKP